MDKEKHRETKEIMLFTLEMNLSCLSAAKSLAKVFDKVPYYILTSKLTTVGEG